jgi:hypothetical protein
LEKRQKLPWGTAEDDAKTKVAEAFKKRFMKKKAVAVDIVASSEKSKSVDSGPKPEQTPGLINEELLHEDPDVKEES